MTVTASPYSFSKKNGAITPLDQNPHQTVTRFGCVGISMYACGFSVPQMRQYGCLHSRQDQNYLHLKIWFFFTKIFKVMSQYFPTLFKHIHNHIHSTVICQNRHELSVTIHEVSTTWKRTLDGGPYTWSVLLVRLNI